MWQTQVESFFHGPSGTASHVAYDRRNGHAAIIDPVLDYDAAAARTSTQTADRIVQFIRSQGLTVAWILETHAHADHLSAAPYIQQQLGGRIAIGEHIRDVQAIFAEFFDLEPSFSTDGSQFDHLFAADETFRIGDLDAQVLFVPGHTPADVAYRIGDAVFVGDTMFMPDVGTARCDFPGGCATTLYASIRRILALPGDTRLFICHDYPPAGRGARWQTTVDAQRQANIHVHDGVSEQEFVAMRTARDRTLGMPALMLPSVQVNIRAGHMPPAAANGRRYLKIPVEVLLPTTSDASQNEEG
ncbi:MAG: MBL fold metallo-hydrolase [Burkholderiales bacterium]|nr:MBL fold metallo-hydrolase [Burkholderiales bacterium]